MLITTPPTPALVWVWKVVPCVSLQVATRPIYWELWPGVGPLTGARDKPALHRAGAGGPSLGVRDASGLQRHLHAAEHSGLLQAARLV